MSMFIWRTRHRALKRIVLPILRLAFSRLCQMVTTCNYVANLNIVKMKPVMCVVAEMLPRCGPFPTSSQALESVELAVCEGC